MTGIRKYTFMILFVKMQAVVRVSFSKELIEDSVKIEDAYEEEND